MNIDMNINDNNMDDITNKTVDELAIELHRINQEYINKMNKLNDEYISKIKKINHQINISTIYKQYTFKNDAEKYKENTEKIYVLHKDKEQHNSSIKIYEQLHPTKDTEIDNFIKQSKPIEPLETKSLPLYYNSKLDITIESIKSFRTSISYDLEEPIITHL